ncbi:MAG TPA: PLP-dependent aminotransferase family protein, partial [Vicinamibacterales bacterium]|nr:PLP-dependent aminotransferase family protein [Vicinamibacterales bacterium]
MIDYDRFLSRGASTMQESAIRKMGALGLRVPDLISFAPGFPAPDTFAWDEFRDVAKSVLDGSDASVLQYGPTRGYRPLVEALPQILAERGIRATPDDMIVTTGSQQALDLCARVLADPGDVVLVELPTYIGAITAFANVQARLVGVQPGADGIDLGDLDRVVARERGAGRRVAFLYVVPNFQNPTGVLITIEKRRALLEWAARRDVLIVEDDPYGALHFDDVATAAETRPIRADDGDGRVVYLSTFSKTVAPGFRVAWIAAPGPIAAKLEIAKQAADLCTGALDQRIVYEVWKRGVLTARLPVLRQYYQRKRTAMEHALRRELGDLVSWPEPKGGFFLWPALPDSIDTDTLLTRALAHAVVYVAGSAF